MSAGKPPPCSPAPGHVLSDSYESLHCKQWMRELSGNNRAVFTQAVGFNVGVIFVSHSVLKHGVPAATWGTRTRQSCRFVGSPVWLTPSRAGEVRAHLVFGGKKQVWHSKVMDSISGSVCVCVWVSERVCECVCVCVGWCVCVFMFDLWQEWKPFVFVCAAPAHADNEHCDHERVCR